MKLPSLLGTTLADQPFRIPEDLGAHPTFLVFGFAHEAREDVSAWKQALEAQNLPYLSVPTTAADLTEGALAPATAAMKAHIPAHLHSRIVQVHRGGPDLLQRLEWSADACAKVLVTDATGTIFAEHALGPFSENAFHELKEALEDWTDMTG